MKLGTWNVALPVSASRRKKLREFTDEIGADVWVITESHDSFSTGHEFCHSSASGRDGNRDNPEYRWVSIQSCYPVSPLETSDPKRTAAARVNPPGGAPFIIFGTVLPWAGDNWPVAFKAAVELQLKDWMQLRNSYPDDEFFVIGDLNQDLVSPPHYYGSKANRVVLESALSTAGLISLTAGENDPVRRDSLPYAAIDHICGLRDSKWSSQKTERWPDIKMPDKSLSDHFGIAVILA